MDDPRRVFLSHTSELDEPPNAWNFVTAAKSAVERAGDAVVEMASFAAAHRPAAHVCRDLVRVSDVLVVMAGLRYGSVVPDRSDVSYVELEYEVAGGAEIPRIVVLIGADANASVDERQVAFRARLRAAGVVATVITPDALETEVLHALTAMGRTCRPVPIGSITVTAHNSSNIQAGHGGIQVNNQHDTGRGRHDRYGVPLPARNHASVLRRIRRFVLGLLGRDGGLDGR